MKRVALLILAALAVKAVLASQVELNSVEAYHWLYAQHPAAGYFDHPPMIGWLVWISTHLFGDSSFGVRAITMLGGALAIWLAYLAGRRLYSDIAGVAAAVLTTLAPMVAGFGTAATPDAPLLLFWIATIWAVVEALHGRAWMWIAAGAFLGLAMLSKYHAAFLGLGIFGFLVFSPDQRSWLRRPQPWLGALVALAVFSPNIAWNAQNGWQSLRYQGVGRFEESRGFRWQEPLEFALSQLLLLTPIVALWCWGLGGRTLAKWRAASWPDRLAAATAFPLLAFFLLLSLVRSVRGHWPAPAYAGALLLVAGWIAQGGPWRRKLYLGTVSVMLVACLSLPVALAFTPREWRTGWEQLAAQVRARKADFVLARDYHDAAQLAYHLRTTDACDFTAVGRDAKSWRNWWTPERYRGKDAIVVYDRKEWPDRLEWIRGAFDSIDEPEEIEVTRFRGKRETFFLVRARGYRFVRSP